MPALARHSILSVALLLAMLVGGPVLRAQEPLDTREPAHVAYLDGAVTLERDGQTETASVNTPIVAGDRLTTTAGRIEFLFPDGTVLDMDEYSIVEFLSPTLLRLLEGRVMLSVAGANDPAGATRYQVDTPVASARTDGPGEFRLAVLGARDGNQTELAVLRGYATLATERGSSRFTVPPFERTRGGSSS